MHALVTRKGEELRADLTELAKQQHEKSATELVEKMGAFEGRHLLQVTELQKPGGRRQPAQQFLQAMPLPPGTRCLIAGA